MEKYWDWHYIHTLHRRTTDRIRYKKILGMDPFFVNRWKSNICRNKNPYLAAHHSKSEISFVFEGIVLWSPSKNWNYMFIWEITYFYSAFLLKCISFSQTVFYAGFKVENLFYFIFEGGADELPLKKYC